jgi:hypothetical protein
VALVMVLAAAAAVAAAARWLGLQRELPTVPVTEQLLLAALAERVVQLAAA